MTYYYNPSKDVLPVEREFAVVCPSFVERGGFMTITDNAKCQELKLPRWAPSPMLYEIDEEGLVWARHFTAQTLYLKYKTVAEFVEAWRKDCEEYLLKNGYSLNDVQD